MGNKINPAGFRLTRSKDWHSRWFAADPNVYRDNLLEDIKIRKFLMGKLKLAGVIRVLIKRSINKMKIILFVSRPGVVIGRGGSGLEILKKELANLVSISDPGKNLELDEVIEVKNPEVSAHLVGLRVTEQLEKRMPYRRVANKTIERVIGAGAKGVKIMLSGRVGGAEIARTEVFQQGKIPLQTLRAKIDYDQIPVLTRSGYVGVKVWIYTGEE